MHHSGRANVNVDAVIARAGTAQTSAEHKKRKAMAGCFTAAPQGFARSIPDTFGVILTEQRLCPSNRSSWLLINRHFTNNRIVSVIAWITTVTRKHGPNPAFVPRDSMNFRHDWHAGPRESKCEPVQASFLEASGRKPRGRSVRR